MQNPLHLDQREWKPYGSGLSLLRSATRVACTKRPASICAQGCHMRLQIPRATIVSDGRHD